MQHMGFVTGLSTPSVSGQKAYEGLFDAKQMARKARAGSSGDARALGCTAVLISVVYHLCNIET